MMPYRSMGPWWDNPVDADPSYCIPDFRSSGPGVEWSGFPDEDDPRLTPSGDIARRGTIPDYVPYAVLTPKRIGRVTQ